MKLFVGNVNYTVGEDQLLNFVAECGVHVEKVEIMHDRETGKSRGFGFITVFDGEEMSKVIENLNGRKVEGRAITVNAARPFVRSTSANYAKSGRR